MVSAERGEGMTKDVWLKITLMDDKYCGGCDFLEHSVLHIYSWHCRKMQVPIGKLKEKDPKRPEDCPLKEVKE